MSLPKGARAIGLATLAVLLLASTGNAKSLATATVNITAARFHSNNVTITAGDTVKWCNIDPNHRHSVVADDGSFNSPALGYQQCWRYGFAAEGSYPYHDGRSNTPHRGVVNVRSAVILGLVVNPPIVKYGDKRTPSVTISGKIANQAAGEEVSLVAVPINGTASDRLFAHTASDGSFSFQTSRPRIETSYQVTWRGATSTVTAHVTPAISFYRWSGLRVRLWLGFNRAVVVPIQVQKRVGPGRWLTKLTLFVTTGTVKAVPLASLGPLRRGSQLRAFLPNSGIGYLSGYSTVLHWR